MTEKPYTYSIDLLAPDGAVARKALAGEPILVYPKGTHHRPVPWGDAIRTWTVDDTVVQQLVDNYAHRETRGLRQSRLPVNEDHRGSRALGWFNQVIALPDGVGATFTWNKKGREALENGEFSYFSVEIWDEVLDRVTGEKVHNQIGGGALTNYPFFGEATALMSRIAGGPSSEFTGGDPMSEELEKLKAERNWLQNLLHSLFARSGAAPAPGEMLEIQSDPLREQFTQLQEQVNQFTAQLQTVQGERDAYAAQLQNLQGELMTVQDARAVERFSVLAESYTHLPAQTSDLAQQLRWLHEADPEGAHREFFTGLLRRADDTFAIYFREHGVQRGTETDTESRIVAAVSAYQAEHPGVEYRMALDAVLTAHPEFKGGVQ
jgi:phage I-like protein